jgi:hypothetical protein
LRCKGIVPTPFFWRAVVEQSREFIIEPDPPQDQPVDSSKKRSPVANVLAEGAQNAAWFQERVERCLHGVKRGMYEALALEFRRKEPQAIDAQDPGLGIISSQWIYNHVDHIAELGRAGVEQHVERTREASMEKVVKDGEESGRAWIQSCRRQVQAFLCSYVSTLLGSLDKLGFREIITKEELQYLRVVKILRPDLNRMAPASFVRFSGHELGIQQSNHDFEERLMFCRAYAFRKGIREAVKELGDELSTDERRFLEKKISLTWVDVRREMDSISVTSAYAEGKTRAEQAVRVVQAQKHSPAIEI